MTKQNKIGIAEIPELDLDPGSQFVGPLYGKVKNVIKEMIISRKWLPEIKIPSENELVKSLKVSRMTVNRALRELAAEGFLVRIQGVGTFVAEQKPRSALLEVKSLSEEIKRSGGVYGCSVNLMEEAVASTDLAHFMGLQDGATLFHTILVHMDNKIPIQYDERYINPLIFPDVPKQDFTKVELGEYLEGIEPFTEAENIIEALMPDDMIRKLLKMIRGEPCLVVNRTTWVDNKVATKARFFHPGNTYRIGGRVSKL